MVFTVRTCMLDDPHSAENQVRHGIVPIGISYPKILSDQRVGAKSRPLDDDSESVQGSHVLFSQSNEVLSVLIGELKG